MPSRKYKGQEYWSHNERDGEFVDAVLNANEGPDQQAVPNPATRRKKIVTQIGSQEAFIARLGGESILHTLHERKPLKGSGSVGWDYAEVDAHGNTTFSGHHLLLNISGIPLGDGGRAIPYNTPVNGPQLMIGLFGNARQMRAGKNDYMTHLAVVMADSRTREGLAQAFARSRKRQYKLANVNSNLDIAQFSDGKWASIHRKAERRAKRFLSQKLNENRGLRLFERRARTIAVATGGFIVGGFAEVAIDKLAPLVGNAIQHFPHIIK